MESNTTRIFNCDNRSKEESSLLILNDHCLMEIFAILQPFDFVKLARTCERLYSIALDVADKCGAKFKEIEFCVLKNISEENVTRSNEQFSDILSVYGGYVESINILNDGSDFIFETIIQKCQKLNRLQLGSLSGVKKLPSQHFSNLRELKIRGYDQIGINEFRKFFKINPDIESLEVDVDGLDGDAWLENNLFTSKFFECLELLPKLTILELEDPYVSRYKYKDLINLLNLTRLPHLTKLSLIGFCIEITFFKELASKSNLSELAIPHFNHRYNVKLSELFPNLEVLHLSDCRIPIFPPKLRLLRLSEGRMFCSEIITIVKQLQFLEEFVVNVDELWTNQPVLAYDWHSRIVDEIGERDLKIICEDSDGVDESVYNSNHLQIIRKRFWPLQTARPVRIPNVYLPL